MTREQAKQNLVTIGIAEPTDEQITNYLNQVQNETRFERDRADKLKDDASKAKALQKQLDDLNSQNMTDIEKANDERDKAFAQVADLQKQIVQMQNMNALAELGIIGDDAKNLIKQDGSLDFATLGKIISDTGTKAAADKEKELLNRTPNPSGNGGNGDGDDNKTVAEQLVEKMFPDKGETKSVISNYINGGI